MYDLRKVLPMFSSETSPLVQQSKSSHAHFACRTGNGNFHGNPEEVALRFTSTLAASGGSGSWSQGTAISGVTATTVVFCS